MCVHDEDSIASGDGANLFPTDVDFRGFTLDDEEILPEAFGLEKILVTTSNLGPIKGNRVLAIVDAKSTFACLACGQVVTRVIVGNLNYLAGSERKFGDGYIVNLIDEHDCPPVESDRHGPGISSWWDANRKPKGDRP